MPSLAREVPGTTADLNFSTPPGGTPADANAVGFRIFSLTAGLPGTQVFPTTVGTYQDVTASPGKYATGSYYAYDSGTGLGWAPLLTEELGLHRIEWRYKMAAPDAYKYKYEDFDVVTELVNTPPMYVGVQDFRDAGLEVATASDAAVIDQILIWQEFIERATRQWFVPRAMTLTFDGHDGDTVFFGVPVISVSSVKINGRDDALDTTYYKVYNNRSGFPDDRKNPKLSLQRGSDRNVFAGPILLDGPMRFRKGRMNQTIVGVFGYVEADGTTPKLIKRALMKLVLEKLQKPLYSSGGGADPPAIVSSVIEEEETDGHRIRYGKPGGGTVASKNGLSGMTDDPEVLNIIKLYRAPIGLATPSHWTG